MRRVTEMTKLDQQGKDGMHGYWRLLWPTRIFSVVILVIGSMMIMGGAILIYLGGSFYYLISGACLVASAIYLWKRSKRGVWIYGLLLLATWLWALAESGLDPWALMPRVAMLTILGLWLLTPWVRKTLNPDITNPVSRVNGGFNGKATVVVLMLLAGFLVAIYYNAGFASSAVVKGETADPTEWLNWGNNKSGTRFSPADQLTPENVNRF